MWKLILVWYEPLTHLDQGCDVLKYVAINWG